jgi:hypothetical protein
MIGREHWLKGTTSWFIVGHHFCPHALAAHMLDVMQQPLAEVKFLAGSVPVRL